MRLLMLIRDNAYCNALAKGIALSSKEIKITIIPFCNDKIDISEYNIVLTDGDVTIFTKEFSKEEMKKFVFLVNYLKEDTIYKYENCVDEFPNYNFIFKYKEIRFFISDILWYYYQVTSEYNCHPIKGTMISFFSDKNVLNCSLYSKMLGKTLLDKEEKNILIFPLTYINSDIIMDDTVETNFKRLMYNINLNRKFPLEPYFYMDMYGLYHFRSKETLNPIPELFMKEFNGLIGYIMRNMFDVIIFDIGSNYNSNNLNVIKMSDKRIIVCEDKNSLLIDLIIKKCDLDEMHNINRIVSPRESKIADYNDEQIQFDLEKVAECISDAHGYHS
ncbi:MAG: hypothetical protein GX078_04790 [Clostridiales bacterium]|nr:hypothetical protein [Clostridiales bacterium]